MSVIGDIGPEVLDQLRASIAHLEHLLPGQGPILDFVHHNTIHGFQHLPFLTALTQYEALTGISGFQPEAVSRKFYQQGRILDADIDGVLASDGLLAGNSAICKAGERTLFRRDVYRVALLHDLPDLSPAQVQWQLQTKGLKQLQGGISSLAAQELEASHADSAEALDVLWHCLQQKLSVAANEDDAEAIEAVMQSGDSEQFDEQAGASRVDDVFERAGRDWSLRTLLLNLSGTDILDTIKPQLIRLGASLMDEGLAPWHITDSTQTSLYGAWRKLTQTDLQLALLEVEGVDALIQSLPDDPIEAIARLLALTGLPQGRWSGYIERVALELPGWMGLINWRQHHPDYHSTNRGIPRLEDFLAIRLALDKLLLDKLCGELWHCSGHYQNLLTYFQQNAAELQVRLAFHQGDLPEYLTRDAGALISQIDPGTSGQSAWNSLAVRINRRQQASVEAGQLNAGQVWKIFCLCQHLGLPASAVRGMSPAQLHSLLTVLESFDANTRGRVWLYAFERHYRDAVFSGLTANRKRGGWLQRSGRFEAQMVLCMDEREESFRRNLEELDPQIETLGAAGFFGIPMQFTGLDAVHSTPLCPVVVKPVHQVFEVARAGEDSTLRNHRTGLQWCRQLTSLLHQRLRLKPLLASLLILLSAPVMLAVLLLDSLLPESLLWARNKLRACFIPTVRTELTLTAQQDDASPQRGMQTGFSVSEQAQRVAGLLRALGLTKNFAWLVVLAGHGSTSLNNPHEAAHDCGACGGRQGGPNARAFAGMANNPQVRSLLADQGIVIPEDCWFIGTQHDTCSDAITWYDIDLVPAALQQRFDEFRHTIASAQNLSARERSRRFASARKARSPASAFQHVTLRSRDISQVRPEYGHATNACAIIGRRQISQGVFLDRRAFLISYDPSSDEDGNILESILMTAGPVGAGISLEYYFSTIDNERFGCGTKIPHNVTGLFGVMEGASSDLRTGLPLQMVEIHEAMRLQVIVEARTDVLARIYGDQPALQELIGGGWLLLSAIDPDTGAISVFDPETGFVPWETAAREMPVREKSHDCYGGLSSPVAPMLIRQPAMAGFRL